MKEHLWMMTIAVVNAWTSMVLLVVAVKVGCVKRVVMVVVFVCCQCSERKRLALTLV